MSIDLTGAEVKIIANYNDEHTIRLSNLEGENAITPEGKYCCRFISKFAGVYRDIEIDTSEIGEGILLFTLVVKSGVYIVYKLDPQQTLMRIKVESV